MPLNLSNWQTAGAGEKEKEEMEEKKEAKKRETNEK